MIKNVAFIGLGVMGFPMAGHLISKNNNLNIKVYNRSIEKSQNWISKFDGALTKTPAEAAEGCHIVFMCVGNDKDVEQVVRGDNGIMSSIPENSIIVDHTTASAKIAVELNKYCKENKNVKYPYRITGSGLRRELFFLLKNQKNVKVVCPIRNFDSFYYSYAKTRHNLNKKFRQKALDDMWEHWRHKVIDYLILREKFPNNIAIVRYEEMVNDTSKCVRKVSKFLDIKFSKKLLIPTVLDIPSLGNSSFKKNEKFRGKIYKKKTNFPKNIKLPNEYREILNLINRVSL